MLNSSRPVKMYILMLVFIFMINGSVLSSLVVDPIVDVKLNVFIDQWYMERGIESERDRMSLPPFNPPKDLEWRQQESNGAWVLKLSAEAEALEQAREEQEKQILIQENEKRQNEEAKKLNDEKERMELERLAVEAAVEAQKEIDEQNIRVAVDVTLKEEEEQQWKVEQNQEKHTAQSNIGEQYQSKKEMKKTQAVEPLNNVERSSKSIKQQEEQREDQEAKSNEENISENEQKSRNHVKKKEQNSKYNTEDQKQQDKDEEIGKKRSKERAKMDAKKKITNEEKSKYNTEDQKQLIIERSSKSIKQQEEQREDQEAKSNEENISENEQKSRNHVKKKEQNSKYNTEDQKQQDKDEEIGKKRSKERAKMDAKKKITNEEKSKYNTEDQKQLTDARRRKRNTNASTIGAKYLHRMTEITNVMRGRSASMEDGDKGRSMKPTQLEIQELREEYSRLKKQYRREFAKQAAQDTIIQDLVQDVYYFSTEPVENVEVDRIQRERLDNTTPSTRVQQNNDRYHSRENAFDMLTKMVNDGTNKLSKEERNGLLEEIDTFKSKMADLKSKTRGHGDVSSSKNVDLRKEIQEDLRELRSQIQSFEGNLIGLLDSRVV